MDSIGYNQLLKLKDLIDNNQATSQQKKEYMEILYRNGNISEQQYDAFLANENADEIIKAALTIGGILLVAWLLSKLLDS